jgi:hypothetical protein
MASSRTSSPPSEAAEPRTSGYELAWSEIFGDDVTAPAMIDRSFTTPRSSPSKISPARVSQRRDR